MGSLIWLGVVLYGVFNLVGRDAIGTFQKMALF